MTEDRIATSRSAWGLTAASDDEPWMVDAVCPSTDPEAFFPEKGGSARAAKQICRGCPVQIPCLDFAMRTDQRFGVFGGLSERDRRALKRGQPLIPCKECGTEFVPRADGDSHRLRRYCSNDCRKLAHRAAKRESDRRRSAA